MTYGKISESLREIKEELDSGYIDNANRLLEDLMIKVERRMKNDSDNVLAYRTSSAKQIKLHSLNNRIFDARKRGNQELVDRLIKEKNILLGKE